MSQWMTRFYTIPMWGFCTITGAVTLLRKTINETSGSMDAGLTIWILIILFAIQVCLSIWVQFKQTEVEMKIRAKAFDNQEFITLFEGLPDKRRERLMEVIKKFNLVRS